MGGTRYGIWEARATMRSCSIASCNFATLRINWDRSAQDESRPLSGGRRIMHVRGLVQPLDLEGTGQVLPAPVAAARDGTRIAAARRGLRPQRIQRAARQSSR